MRTAIAVASALLALAVLPTPAQAAPALALVDDFESGSLSPARWMPTGVTVDGKCGANSGVFTAHFFASGPRILRTVPLDVSQGGAVTYSVRSGSSSTQCQPPEADETLTLQYSLDGASWTTLLVHVAGQTNFASAAVALPPTAWSPATSVRWVQSSNSGTNADAWAVDDVAIGRDVDATLATRSAPSSGAPATPVATPDVDVPEACTAEACHEATQESTEPVPVPEACVPPDPLTFLCVGPFTIPAFTTPEAPAVCDAAGQVCVGPFTVPGETLATTPAIQVSVRTTTTSVEGAPHAGERIPFGPIHLAPEAPGVGPIPPIGPIPIVVCPNPETCGTPHPPEGGLDLVVTVRLTVGSSTVEQSVPVHVEA